MQGIRLCGGVFLAILRTCSKPRAQVRDGAVSKAEGGSDTDLYKSLVKIFNPEVRFEDGANLTSHVSKFKSCKGSGERYGIGDKTQVTAFRIRSEKEFSNVAKSMSKLAKDYLSETPEKRLILVKRLLALVKLDDMIEDEQLFRAGKNGELIKKTELYTSTEICFETLMLGLWLYIVEHEDYREGRATYEKLFKGTKKGEYKYIGDLETHITQTVNVVPYDIEHTVPNDELSERTVDEAESLAEECVPLISDEDKALWEMWKQDFSAILRCCLSMDTFNTAISADFILTIADDIERLKAEWPHRARGFSNPAMQTITLELMQNVEAFVDIIGMGGRFELDESGAYYKARPSKQVFIRDGQRYVEVPPVYKEQKKIRELYDRLPPDVLDETKKIPLLGC